MLAPIGPRQLLQRLTFFPKKSFLPVRFRVANPEEWIPRLSEAGIDAELKRGTPCPGAPEER